MGRDIDGNLRNDYGDRCVDKLLRPVQGHAALVDAWQLFWIKDATRGREHRLPRREIFRAVALKAQTVNKEALPQNGGAFLFVE